MTQNHLALPAKSSGLGLTASQLLTQIFNLPYRRPSVCTCCRSVIHCCSFTALWLAVIIGLPTFSVSATSVTEPPTIFYGKIIDISSPYGSLVTTGALTWIVHRADGLNQVLRATIQPLNGGLYSYSLNVPHEALALGLLSSPDGVPLRSVDDIHTNFLIAVNNRTARIIGPNGSTFVAAQARRAATYRVDLAVALNPVDSDNSGLPDWWKLKYGVTDPYADPDGDGLNNLAEFRNGSDPTHDDRIPSLVTKDQWVYADGTTVMRLRAIDSDSGPTNLTYSVVRAPSVGTLYLRNASASGTNHDQLLEPGAVFTQSDVNRGRVIFVHGGDSNSGSGDTFDLSLHDETPAHPTSTNTVALNIYRPDHDAAFSPATAGTSWQVPLVAGFAAEQQPFVSAYLLSRDKGYVIFDASAETASSQIVVPSSDLTSSQYASQYEPSFGPDRSHVFLGGMGNDSISGSMEADVIIGGPGDDSLRGNGGADLFLFTSPTDGNDTIEDFNLAENDAIDISRLLTGTSTQLTDYVQISSTSTNSALRISFNGTGSPYNDMVITLTGVQFSPSDLYDLVQGGHLFTGDKSLPSRVNIIASVPNARQNGPTPGEFTLTRTGSTASALSIDLLISGSAANGVDYQSIPSRATFLAGQTSVAIPITPYVDRPTLLSEIVTISLQSGTGYVLGSNTTALVTIQALVPELSLEAYQPVAAKTGQTPGLLLVNRTGALDRSVFVRLDIGGTAVNGVDYTRVNSFLNLGVGQTSGTIEIDPKSDVAYQGGKSVQISIIPDASYLVGAGATARVMLVDEMMSLLVWRARFFPSSTSSIGAFAAEDPGSYGIPNLLRYAYGLDPIAPDKSRLPQPTLRNGYLTLDLWQRPDSTDLNYSVEVSKDLSSWNSSTNSLLLSLPTGSNDPNVISFRALPATKDAQQLFMKVRVNYAP
jgi:hypothetical protein